MKATTIFNLTTSRRPLLSLVLLILLTLSTTASALKQPTSYCKCICFQNSTIIPLNSPPPPASTSTASAGSFLKSLFLSVRATDDGDPVNNTETESSGRKHHTLTCNDCNRAFCLEYNLPICRNAKEEDVFATCFQRDSLKDRTIVILFLLATSSLLGWALIKPFVVKTKDKFANSDLGGRYTAVSGRGQTLTTRWEDGDGAMAGEERAGLSSLQGGSHRGNDQRDGVGERRLRTGGGSLSRQGGLNS